MPEPALQRVRLEYLDGVRGLAALYVVIGHVYMAIRFWGGGMGLPAPVLKSMLAFNFGHYAVDVFIVLSGYVLMLPVLHGGGRLAGGLSGYLRRRARRILPPFYAAIGLSFVLYLLAPGERVPWTTAQLMTHLLTINNWHADWTLPFNTPLWSVSTEWQIYFFFPLVLLPLRRRMGIGAAIVGGFVVGLGLYFATGAWIEKAHPWYLGLFALGMGAAQVGFGDEARWIRLRERGPWIGIVLLFGALLAVISLKDHVLMRDARWVADAIAGIVVAALLVDSTERVRGARRHTPLTRLLTSSPAVGLGRFSYSIYLMHFPLLYVGYRILLALPLPPVAQAAGLYLVLTPIILALCWAFFQAFERPFLPSRKAA